MQFLTFAPLADMNSAEKHGIFDFALDNAAVRNNAVARTAAAAVIRGHLILDFCINRVRGIEQILLHSGLKQRKIMLIKCIDGVQSCNIAVVLPAAEPVFIHIFDKNILHEIKLAVCGRSSTRYSSRVFSIMYASQPINGLSGI